MSEQAATNKTNGQARRERIRIRVESLRREPKLGMLGSSVLYPSGDNGVAGFGDFCLTADGQQDTDGARFQPTFPGSCTTLSPFTLRVAAYTVFAGPYVTAVGGTQIAPGKTVSDPEQAANDPGYFSTGGGFSNIFPMVR